MLREVKQWAARRLCRSWALDQQAADEDHATYPYKTQHAELLRFKAAWLRVAVAMVGLPDDLT